MIYYKPAMQAKKLPLPDLAWKSQMQRCTNARTILASVQVTGRDNGRPREPWSLRAAFLALESWALPDSSASFMQVR